MQALMQQAQKMQKEMQKKQAELEATTFDVTSAGGAIKIKIKGTNNEKWYSKRINIYNEGANSSRYESGQYFG